MIDITPPIGTDSMNSSTGIKGKPLNSFQSMLQPYYRRDYAHSKPEANEEDVSDAQYGYSEDFNHEGKENSQGNSQPKRPKMKGGQKWLKFNEEEGSLMPEAGYKRTYSLDKREVAALKKGSPVLQPVKSPPTQY